MCAVQPPPPTGSPPPARSCIRRGMHGATCARVCVSECAQVRSGLCDCCIYYCAAAAVLCSPITGFLITGSMDGHIKFWKKQFEGIEFVAHYRGHMGALHSMALSQDELLLATVGADKSLKLFDVQSFDMTTALKLSHTPFCVEFASRIGAATLYVATYVRMCVLHE
eukprot:GHVU01186211.1.p2 GENE.GHVU01186211.1~~GHVU01186211.1.p2  ORF type:complete len:167 (+),score=14.09 GHVU01186211.1:613-1113(+)